MIATEDTRRHFQRQQDALGKKDTTGLSGYHKTLLEKCAKSRSEQLELQPKKTLSQETLLIVSVKDISHLWYFYERSEKTFAARPSLLVSLEAYKTDYLL